jgi:hypothetical protein
MTVDIRSRGVPTIPFDVAEEVELFARQWGRHARMEWSVHLNAPVIHFSMPKDSKLWKMWQEGELDREPTESVPLIERDPNTGRIGPINLADYGASGVRELLEKSNVWSGRGKHKNLLNAIRENMDRNAKNREEMRKKANEIGREIGWLSRRSALELPQSQVLIDLKSPPTPMEGKQNGKVNGKEKGDSRKHGTSPRVGTGGTVSRKTRVPRKKRKHHSRTQDGT